LQEALATKQSSRFARHDGVDVLFLRVASAVACRGEGTLTTVYDFSAATLDGEELQLKAFAGRVLLIVNTASACGFTPQYQQLEALQRALGPRGFSVLGFPCNQFGGQEPGSAQQIAEFCSTKYDVTFPMFGKVDVNGDNALPLFDHLKSEKPGLLGKSIKWNFTKFLVDRSGKVVERYGSTTAPSALTRDIEKLL
jgi:glutathione peroxidase